MVDWHALRHADGPASFAALPALEAGPAAGQVPALSCLVRRAGAPIGMGANSLSSEIHDSASRFIHTIMDALPNHRCPLCGGPNACAPAKIGTLSTPCWCRDAVIASNVLAKVPEAQRQQSCVCAACATLAARGAVGGS
jgi:hypothetical protein